MLNIIKSDLALEDAQNIWIYSYENWGEAVVFKIVVTTCLIFMLLDLTHFRARLDLTSQAQQGRNFSPHLTNDVGF